MVVDAWWGWRGGGLLGVVAGVAVAAVVSIGWHGHGRARGAAVVVVVVGLVVGMMVPAGEVEWWWWLLVARRY